jgi:hypothetical protein
MHGLITSYVVDPVRVKPSPVIIDGHTYKPLSKSQKAALAVDILHGKVSLRPTLKVVAKALGVSVTYIEAAAHLSPEDLRRLRRGELTVPQTLAPAPVERAATTVADVAAWWSAASDAERIAFVREVGVGSPWDAIAANLA